MSSISKFLFKQWFSILLLVTVAAGVVWAVKTQRPRGSMSVVEAQSMDMTAMRAPTGAYPVATGHALERTVGGSSTYPATVQALNDEDVVARVDGLVAQLSVYPGDRVKPGQLLGTIDAKELKNMSSAGQLGASAARLKASAMQSMVAQEQAALARARADVKTAEARAAQATAMLHTATTQVAVAQQEVPRIQAEVEGQQAELDLAEANVTRAENLYRKGYVSKQNLDENIRNRETALSKLKGAKAARQQAESALAAAKTEVQTAQAGVTAASSELAAMRSSVVEAEARVRTARDQAVAELASASAMGAEAAAASTVESYTQLRAVSGGVVTARVVSPGTAVMQGQTVLKVKADDRLRVQADLPQALAKKVLAGSPVRIRLGDQVIETQVTTVFPFVDDASRTFRIEMLIDNRGSQWEVGSYAGVEVFTDERARRLAVPNEAVKTASDGTRFVWLVKQSQAKEDPNAEYTCTMHPQVTHKGPGICPLCKMDLVPRDARGGVTVARTPVTVGVSDTVFTEIVSGIERGSEVTVGGDDELFPGAAVTPKAQILSKDPEKPKARPNVSMGPDSGAPRPKREPQPPAQPTDKKYTCPMHPEVVEDKPGICPICKMDLVPQTKGGE